MQKVSSWDVCRAGQVDRGDIIREQQRQGRVGREERRQAERERTHRTQRYTNTTHIIHYTDAELDRANQSIIGVGT